MRSASPVPTSNVWISSIIEGRVTAGRLAELTGLTTGAITGVVDRMEKAGLVRRERDEEDRRKVYVAIVPEALGKVGRFYEPLQKAVTKDWEGYTDAELKLLVRFLTQGYDTMIGVLDDLKAQQAPACSKVRRSRHGNSSGLLGSRSAAANMPHIAPSIIQKCRQWSVSMMKLSPTVPRKAAKIAR